MFSWHTHKSLLIWSQIHPFIVTVYPHQHSQHNAASWHKSMKCCNVPGIIWWSGFYCFSEQSPWTTTIFDIRWTAWSSTAVALFTATVKPITKWSYCFKRSKQTLHGTSNYPTPQKRCPHQQVPLFLLLMKNPGHALKSTFHPVYLLCITRAQVRDKLKHVQQIHNWIKTWYTAEETLNKLLKSLRSHLARGKKKKPFTSNVKSHS